MSGSKSLFIISPIGPRNSEIRIHFDKVRKHIIDPVATEKGYVSLRSDDIARPGRITSQIIDHLRNDDLVVADLSRRNPNVYYELAIRHAVQKPVILIGESDLNIPFDLSAQRVIPYSLDPDDINEAKNQLSSQIESVKSDKFIVDSPITDVIDLTPQDIGSEEKTLQRILAILETQSQEIKDLKATSTHEYPGFVREANIAAASDWLSPRHRSIIDVFTVMERDNLTISGIAEIVGLHRRMVSVILSELILHGIIERDSTTRPYTFSLK